MNFNLDHPLQPYWQLAATPIQVEALEFALEVDLFTLLRRSHSAIDVATVLSLDSSATAILLDLLWSMGLLTRGEPGSRSSHAPSYHATVVAQRFFSDTSPDSCKEAWRYRANFLRGFSGQLAQVMRHGADAALTTVAGGPPGNWADAAQLQISQEQRAATVPSLLRLLDGLNNTPSRGRFLDLGGGPGFVAIALAQRYTLLQGVVFDLPETATVASQNIHRAGLSSRIVVKGGNLDEDDIGDGYELIWCSSVLHFLADPQAALCKIFAALKPGGLLLIAHAEIPPDAPGAARVLPFYLPMMLRGRYVPRHSEVVNAMGRAGFRDIRSTQATDFPLAPVWLHCGYHP